MGRAGISILEVLVASSDHRGRRSRSDRRTANGIKENQHTYSREVAASLARQLLEEVDSLSYEPTAGTYANCLNATASANTFANPCAALSAANPLNAQAQNVAAGGYTRQWSIQNSGGGRSDHNKLQDDPGTRAVDRPNHEHRGPRTRKLIVTANKAWTFPTSP